MKQSEIFSKTKKTSPAEEKSINAKLLIRAGFVDKLMAGVYSYLPLGFLVIENIENIIRKEIKSIGGQEILMPALQPKENWQKTGRWDNLDILYRLKDKSGREFALGPTHEEVLSPLVKKFVNSYKDLPFYIYQIQDKFRMEPRAKSGLLRGREFMMKDLYSFHKDEKDLDNYYEKVKKIYFKIFKRCGLEKETFLTLASGGTFSKYSHEFQTISPFGEDDVYLCQKCRLGINKEIIKDQKYQCPECKSKKLEIKKAIEVGNIFKLKDKYTKPFDLKFKDKNGKEKLVLMGCYGIGIGRLMGAVVEVNHDKKGIIWPKQVSPFLVHLLEIGSSLKVRQKGQELYKDLQQNDIKVLYDDRKEKTAGEKFADADLIGIPYRIVISEKTIKKESAEVKERNKKQVKIIKVERIIHLISNDK